MIDRYVRLFALFLIILLFPTTIIAKGTYYYKQLNITHGLTQSKVTAICHDYKGYLWIGTEYGLNFYDRDVLKSYFNKESDLESLPSNEILFIKEDNQKNLWIGTSSGLCLFNRVYSSFKRIMYQNKPLVAYSMTSVKDGVIFGGDGTLYKYQYSDKTINRLELNADKIPYSPFLQIQSKDDDRLLINTRWYGIYSYHLTSHRLEKLSYVPNGNHLCIFVDSQGRLWVSDYGKGVSCYENRMQIGEFNTQNSPLTYDVITSIEEKDGYLWLATDGGGLNFISLIDFVFKNIMQVQDDISSFPTNSINTLYKDPMQNMWAGSIRKGLICIYKVNAKSYSNVPFHNVYGMSNSTVNCVYEDQDGDIWIGTDGGGVNKYDPETRLFTHYDKTKNGKIISIIDYDKNTLMISVFSIGVYLFDKHTGKITPFIIQNKKVNKEMCADGYAVFLYKMADGQILLSASHVFLYDQKRQTFKSIATKGKDYNRNSPMIVKSFEDEVYLIDQFKILKYISTEEKFSNIYEGEEQIYDVCIDDQDNLWIATDKGLFEYNTITKKKTQHKPELFGSVNSLTIDRSGVLWIGLSSNLLFRYDTQSHQVSLLSESEGFISNEYTRDGMMISRNGTVYIGGTMGMTITDNVNSSAYYKGSQIFLADVLVNGTPYQCKENTSVQQVVLPWDFNSLQLKFNMKESIPFRRHAFKYRIISRNRDEEINSFSHTLTIPYLPEGKHKIIVSYITPQGSWSKPQEIAHIEVLPPLWKSRTFLLIYLLAFILCAILVARSIYKHNQKRHQKDMQKINEELSKEKIRFLLNLSHEVRIPLNLICSPLKQIIEDDNSITDVLKQKLRNIYKQSVQMQNLIDMVIDVKKLEDGDEVLHIIPTNLNEWIKRVTEHCMPTIRSKNMTVFFELDQQLETVPFDQQKCTLILNNFIVNAVKYSDPFTIITVRSKKTKDLMARVEIQDQGTGIEDSSIPHLFSMYYQDEKEKRGSGIGLPYSKTLIDMHNGKIGAINNPEKGATFFFELPLSKETAQKTTNIPAIEYPSKEIVIGENKNSTILIVSESTELRDYLSDSFRKYFNHVLIAKNGEEGIKITKILFPDIVISDLIMSKMNGFKLCEMMKQHKETSHIPIILLTAYSNPVNRLSSYRLGADAFVAKPFDIDELLAIVNNQISLRKSIKNKYRISEGKAVIQNNAEEQFMDKLNHIINRNLGNAELNVDFLTKEMGISRTLLYNRIKEVTGMGIVDYINKNRIDHAISLLLRTETSITEISEKVGFSSPRYFSKVFKSITNQIPSEYRTKHKEQK